MNVGVCVMFNSVVIRGSLLHAIALGVIVSV